MNIVMGMVAREPEDVVSVHDYNDGPGHHNGMPSRYGSPTINATACHFTTYTRTSVPGRLGRPTCNHFNADPLPS